MRWGLHPDSCAPLHDERVVAVREEPQLHYVLLSVPDVREAANLEQSIVSPVSICNQSAASHP